MRVIFKAIALLVVLGAPVAGSSFLMSQALAADAGALDPALQTQLDAALEGTPEEVEDKLQALLDANPDDARAIAAQARAQAPASVLAAVTGITRTYVATNSPPGNNTSLFGNFMNNQNNNGGMHTIWFNNQAFVFDPNTEEELRAIFLFNQILTPNLFAFNQTQLYGWAQNFNFETCLLGTTMKVGPYGTVSGTVSRGC